MKGKLEVRWVMAEFPVFRWFSMRAGKAWVMDEGDGRQGDGGEKSISKN